MARKRCTVRHLERLARDILRRIRRMKRECGPSRRMDGELETLLRGVGQRDDDSSSSCSGSSSSSSSSPSP